MPGLAILFSGARSRLAEPRAGLAMSPGAGAVLARASSLAAPKAAAGPAHAGSVAAATAVALKALEQAVGTLSHPLALADAFHGYFAFKAAHPDDVKKPFLYFVDYGLPSTTRRGWVFDMSLLSIVEGPFTVAHGRGSSPAGAAIPARFSNALGSDETSLGLYVARELYAFTGHSGSEPYNATGMRLDGVSTGFNDNALARKVVAHGAPYVTSTKAGRSDGCPAMELARASRLLPKLANGGMVFLFAPDARWMNSDPWVTAN
ncbi:MAG TPA: murein L,D-transpeptidase catalytic domain family protein [Gemmatimonadaceae bacterium]|nr:murein L,D-transpeptidase catalytic domain family protein [Gemmatimonadaceae bacterium]